MSVLIDTSVWIDHFHRGSQPLSELLERGLAWTHAVVIGELAAGRLAQRAEVLHHLQKLPRAQDVSLTEGLHLLDQYRLHGRGLSWADIQILAAARIDHLAVWTRDRALLAATKLLGMSA